MIIIICVEESMENCYRIFVRLVKINKLFYQ